MKNSTKIGGAIAAAALIAAGSSAFTAGGLALGGTAGDTKFIGGQVSSSVTGATLTSIAYEYDDEDTQLVDQIDLSFAGNLNTAPTKVVRVLLNGSTATGFDCTIGTYNAGTTSTPVICGEHVPGVGGATPFGNLNDLKVTVANA